MTYKDSLAIFELRYRLKGFGNNLPRLTRNEMMLYMSIAQKFIQDNYKVYKKSYSLTTVIGQSQYVMGTGATNIPSNLYAIESIKRSTEEENITMVSREEMNTIVKSSPITKYCFYNNILEFDCIPTEAETITINYVPELSLFDSYAGTATNLTFPDSGDNQWRESDLTKTWILPKQWHLMIIEGGLSEIFPNMKEAWLMQCEILYSNRFQTLNLNLPHHIGG